MTAVQAYACANGKGKKPSRTTNALARRRQETAAATDEALGPSGVAPVHPQAHPRLELRGVHCRRARLAAGRAPSVVVGPRQPPNRPLRWNAPIARRKSILRKASQ